MHNKDLQNFSFGLFFVQKMCYPKFCNSWWQNFFLHFHPTVRLHILIKIEVTQIAQTSNFYRHFSTNFKYGFDFLIYTILCLNCELHTFKKARFFKTHFLKEHTLHCKYYDVIKLAMLLKYIYEIVMKQYEG